MHLAASAQKSTNSVSGSLRAALARALQSVRLPHLLGLFYLGMACALATTRVGIVQFAAEQNLPIFALTLAFAAAGATLMSNPGPRVFLACLLPMAIYAALVAAYIASGASASPAGVLALLSNLAFSVILQFRRVQGVRLWHIMAICMAVVGAAILQYPERGTAGALEARWGIPGEALGFALIIGSLLVGAAGRQARALVFLGGTVFAAYAAASLMLPLVAGSPNAGIASVASGLLFFLIMWAGISPADYFE
jgi:hypothetical protein